MRQKTFSIGERAVLIPVELVAALKYFAFILPALFLVGGLGGTLGFWANAFNYGFFAASAAFIALICGAVLTPIMLPWLPGRAFSVKGLSLGLIAALMLMAFRAGDMALWSNRLELMAWFLLIPAVTAYLAMNFTGASTYTSLSGVKKEMRRAVPLQIAAGVVGLGLWIGSRYMA
jgi:acetyl-CoA decarbonylase/synthase complex subunit gamma